VAVEALIPPEEAAAAREMARAMPDLLKAGLTVSGGSLDDLDKRFFVPLGLTGSQVLGPALFCAVSLQREAMWAAIAGFTNAATLEAELSSETNGLPVHEIAMLAVREGHPLGEPRALIRSLRPLLGPLCHPATPPWPSDR
jgi:hypothetical protein